MEEVVFEGVEHVICKLLTDLCQLNFKDDISRATNDRPLLDVIGRDEGRSFLNV